jgi:hypothetical protein
LEPVTEALVGHPLTVAAVMALVAGAAYYLPSPPTIRRVASHSR